MDLASRKRIIYILILLIILGSAGFLIYRYLLPAAVTRPRAPGEPVTGRVPLRPGVLPTPAPPGIPPPFATPPAEALKEARLVRLTDFAIISPSLNKKEDAILFYKKDGGDLYSSDFDGRSLEKISNLTIIGLFDALWSPERDRAVPRYLDGENIKTFLHIGTSSVRALPSGITSVAWSPSGTLLSYILPEELSATLVTTDRTGGKQQTLVETPLRDATIQWVTDDKLIFETRPSGLAEGFVFSFSRKGETFTRLIGPAFGLTTLWSPGASKLLVSRTDERGKNLRLLVAEPSGKTVWQTELATLPEKCVWLDAQEFYCASPTNILSSHVWPDDYLRGEIAGADRLFAGRVDTRNLHEIPLDGSLALANIIVTKDKKTLFFVKRDDGTLWRLKLNQ